MKALVPPPFSIVLIARNEAHTLPRLIRSLSRFRKRGGDMVLVDTGSTDATVRIARDAGFRIERARSQFHSTLTQERAVAINTRFAVDGEGPLVRAGTRMFHFGNAREFAAKHAVHDMVLHLDASDTVSALELDFLQDEILNGAARRFRYWKEYGSTRNPTDVSTYQLDWFYDRRLWRWQGTCHEGLIARDDAANTARIVECTPEQLLVRHIKNEGKKRDYYLPALALDALEQPTNARRQHYLGRELYYARHSRSALAVLEPNATAEDNWVAQRSESLCLAGACYEALGERTAARRAYERAAALDGTRREPLLRLAGLAQAQGDFEGCVQYAYAALAIPRTSAYMERTANYSYLPHAFLYWALLFLGRKAEAQKHWEQCLTLLPKDKRFRADGKLFGIQA